MNAGKLAMVDPPAACPYHGAMDRNNADAAPGVFWFVSRHPGAIEWAKRQDLAIDRWVTHLDPTEVGAGDTVVGTLPVNLAAKICQQSAHYLHLSLEVPATWRGRELSADDLQAFAARVETYRIERVAPDLSSELA